MSTSLRVLIVEDSDDDLALLLRELRRGGYEPTYRCVSSAEEMRQALETESWNLILADYNTPRFSAPAQLELLHESGCDLPFILVSGSVSEEDAVNALKAGAHDFISKDRLARLLPAITREMGDAAVRQEYRETERRLRESEEQLQHAQRMEAVGRLAGGIAHDFNNLLTVIRGNVELALLTLPPEHEIRDDLTEIREATERASSLTGQLLAFSRRQLLRPRVLELNETIAGMEKMLRRLLGGEVEIRVVPDPQLGRVRADPGQIEQVIANLAINARDAMPQGGTLTLASRNATLGQRDLRRYPYVLPGRYVLLEVSDTGHGMDLRTQAQVFEPFFTTKETGKGMGLGLSTVYGIVKQSGGYIWVDSEIGAGTTFRIYLPRIEDEVEPFLERSVVPESYEPTETILLVEDDDAVRHLVARVLRRRGYTVLEASRAAEAIQLWEKRGAEIDLLLADVMMPGMSGPELAERLGEEHPDLRVVLMSGHADVSVLRRGGLDADARLLHKPFDADIVTRTVREALAAPPAAHRG